MSKIKLAIIGVGNCASSLVQGIEYYKENPEADGVMYREIGPYRISDIEVVSAIDVNSNKVGKDLSEAIFIKPNCAKKFSEVLVLNVEVKKGELLDGVASHMNASVPVSEEQQSIDIVSELKNSGADICISYLPVGSADASRFYAQACLDAGVCFINAIPEFICSEKEWSDKFKDAGLVCVGDDIKSQTGATIIHRVLTRLLQDRGHTVDNTYQLNIGGNTDFENMTDENRLISKRKSKTQAVTSILDDGEKIGVKIGPSDYIPHLEDNKVCYINIKGRQFGNLNYEVDLKLSVEDSPNSAGVMADVIRATKYVHEKGYIGNVNEISAYAFKSPEEQVRDDVARKNFEIIIDKN